MIPPPPRTPPFPPTTLFRSTDNNGCSATAQVTVTVNPLPVITVTPPPAICNGQSATLTAGGAQTYSWTPSTNLSASTGSPVIARASASTTDTVPCTDKNCCSATAHVTVTVHPL